MIAKVHENNGRKIVAVCDEDILGKTFEEGKLILDLNSSFYKGEPTDKEDILRMFKGAYVINLAGEKSVNLGIEEGLVDKEYVVRIKNIPHAQVMLC